VWSNPTGIVPVTFSRIGVFRFVNVGKMFFELRTVDLRTLEEACILNRDSGWYRERLSQPQVFLRENVRSTVTKA
jgi:hypothetical protein